MSEPTGESTDRGQAPPPPPQQPQPPAGWQPGTPTAPMYVVPGSAQGYPPNSEERTWAWLSHASFFALGIIGPLIVMLTKGNQSPFVRRHAVEALNFHLSILIYTLGSIVLMIVLIGIFTLFAALIFGVVVTILAITAAVNGQDYRYPLCIRMVS